MSSQVQLYVYDLSNGLAKQLSMQLTGRQIDGVWHTSVVVYGKEIFYGQGISITAPGRSHHGSPLQVVAMGETEIDEETFESYLDAMRAHYTADKYHLLDFNCNSFTNDCVGFLTGNSIPTWIKDLPSDFLSTPFGAALRPTIDNMFRRTPTPQLPTAPRAAPAPSAAAAAQALPNPQLAASLIQAFADRATQPAMNGMASSSTSGSPATSTISAPVQICTNQASFASLRNNHRVMVAFFTSATCGPCRMIEPTFESIAHEKTRGRAGKDFPAFVKIDLDTGSSVQVAAQFGVRATPTFIFFLDGQKVGELKGANAPELKTQVDLLLFQAFPPHPHTKLSLPSVEGISLSPILFTQVPNLEAVLNKFNSFVDAAAATAPPEYNASQIKELLSKSVLPYLQARAAPDGGKGKAAPSAPAAMLTGWARATITLANTLPLAQLFPLIDMWRLAVLDPAVCTILAPLSPTYNPLHILLARAHSALTEEDASVQAKARNTVLTSLRLLSNILGAEPLARGFCGVPDQRARMLDVLVPSLLHADAQVRTAAASAAFNVTAALQRPRVAKVKSGRADNPGGDFEGEWEVDLTSALVEAIGRETQSEDVVHRLTASLALLLRLAPKYEEDLGPLLQVLQAKDILQSKLTKGQCGENGVQKKDVKALVQEVATKLCQ